MVTTEHPPRRKDWSPLFRRRHQLPVFTTKKSDENAMNASDSVVDVDKDNDDEKYKGFPLAQSMLRYEKVRTASLKQEGKNQIEYPQSNDGWVASLFIIRGRALDWILLPWTVAMLHATVYTVVSQVVFESPEQDLESWEIFFSFVLNASLSLLLVFRLNRAASRFWTARKLFGDIVARSRTLGSGLVVHGDHNLDQRDDALRWMAAFAIASMEYLRGETESPVDNYAGLLTKDQIERLEGQPHPPLFAADKMRRHMNDLFLVDNKTTQVQMAIANSQQLDRLEEQLNGLVWAGGGLERIKASPLPIVYVSHLRSFIMLSLLLMPWVFGPSWGWSTIPIVAISAFAWLGIESAAQEVECPFRKDRVNALNMDAYVIGLLSTLQQQVMNHADEDIASRYAKLEVSATPPSIDSSTCQNGNCTV